MGIFRKAVSVMSLIFFACVFLGAEIIVPLDGECLLVDPHPRALKVAPDGTIVIADRHNYRMLVFSSEGRFLRSFGEQGEGPGQFKRWFGEFTIGPDNRIYQVDFWGGNRGISVFSTAGSLIRFIRINLNGNFGPRRIFVNGNNKIILALARDQLKTPVGSLLFMGSNVVFCGLNHQGKINEEYFRSREFFDFSSPSGGGWPAIPHRVNLICAWSSEGEFLAWQKSDEDRVHLYNMRNKTTKIIDNGFVKKPVTASHIREWIREHLTYPGFRRMEPLYRRLARQGKTVESHLPLVRRLFFDSQKNLYAAARNSRNRSWTVHMINADGKLSRRIKVKQIPSWIGKNRVYSIFYEEEADHNILRIQKRSETVWK